MQVEGAIGLDGQVGDIVAVLLEVFPNLMLAECSTLVVMTWRLPVVWRADWMAVLFDSVPQLVKVTSLGSAFTKVATFSRAASTCPCTRAPKP